MKDLLAPERRRGVEFLDDPAVDAELMRRSMKDVERANLLFGGRRAAIAELEPAFAVSTGAASLLDVGTGRGDIAFAAKRSAARTGLELHTFGIDISEPLVSAADAGSDSIVRGDALTLPFRDKSVDFVLASQVLHHFSPEGAIAVVREMNRVGRKRVVISDLRRSFVAAAGLWIGSFPLRFHPVSRHDGVVSVMRGFLPRELGEIVQAAIGIRPSVRRRLGFRLTTSWTPK